MSSRVRRVACAQNVGDPECFKEAVEESVEVTRQYMVSEVGSARRRGVGRVMPGEVWLGILAAKLRGHYQYDGVSENSKGISNFYYVAINLRSSG